MGDDASALIQLGFVGAPFGVRGWIKLRSHTDPPERLLEHRSLRIGQGSVWQSYRIEASGRSGGALTVKLSGVEDRRCVCRAASCRNATTRTFTAPT